LDEFYFSVLVTLLLLAGDFSSLKLDEIVRLARKTLMPLPTIAPFIKDRPHPSPAASLALIDANKS